MYSLILMMAMNTTGAELPAFGRSFSCDGGCWSCSGGHGCNGCFGGAWRRGRLFDLGHGCNGCDGGCHGCDGACFGCDGGCHGGFFRGLFGRLHGCGGCFGCDGGCFGGHGGDIIHVPAAPASPEPPKAAEPNGKAAMGAAKATLVLNVPADARVTIDGEATSSNSNVRVFSTPTLQAGYSYRYIVQAEMVVNGQKVVETKAVNVRAGEETRVNFEPAIAMPMPRGEIITRTSNVVR
ncbi:MAG: TIGR03000 domain-containing protein [Planctomycetia bacterium]|nr:TIGR03000 domain-containing protein [Planctomycetia bacterium]